MERLTGCLPLTKGLGVLAFSLGSDCGSGSKLESVYSKSESWASDALTSGFATAEEDDSEEEFMAKAARLSETYG